MPKPLAILGLLECVCVCVGVEALASTPAPRVQFVEYTSPFTHQNRKVGGYVCVRVCVCVCVSVCV